MAISRDKKQQVVDEVAGLLASSKMTVYARYEGLSVAEAQELRRLARDSQTALKVVKNRLVKVAAGKVETFKNADLSPLSGQLIYAFNDQDEVAPAQVLAQYARKHPALKLSGAFDSDGNMLDESKVKQLSELPGKDQLRGQVVGTIAAPLTGLMGVMSGNIRSIITVLNARAETIK